MCINNLQLLNVLFKMFASHIIHNSICVAVLTFQYSILSYCHLYSILYNMQFKSDHAI